MRALKTQTAGLVLAALAPLLGACDIGDVASLSDGQEERFVITDKNAGTLSVREDYRDCVALYEFRAERPLGVESIEFTADGTYHITLAGEAVQQAPSQERSISVEAEGRRVSVPLGSATRAAEQPGRKPTGTYTHSDGHYVLMGDYDWVLADDGTITITEDGATRQYQATRVAQPAVDALTERLCHTWTLSRVLLKLYNGGKLVLTYHLTDEEVSEYCVDTFVFTAYKKFKRYAKGANNGNGDWDWKLQSEQSMTYWFRYLSDTNTTPVRGSNDLTVYFAGNRLYLTEECEALDESDYKNRDGETVKLKAVLLYQLDVKGN